MDGLITNSPTLLGSNIIIINLHEMTDKNNPKQKRQHLNLLLQPQSLQENSPPIMIYLYNDHYQAVKVQQREYWILLNKYMTEQGKL